MPTKQKQAIPGEGKPSTVRPGPSRRIRASVINPWEAVYHGHYDLAEFIAKYGLKPMEAREIFARIGPTRTNLDQFMTQRDTQAN